jgi:CysZ protein
MITAAVAAAEQIFTPPFRAALLKTLGATIALLVACGAGLEHLVVTAVVLPHAAWLGTLLHALAALGLVAAAVLLITPVSFVIGSFFFDALAAQVEADLGAAPGRAMPLTQAIVVGLRFALLSLAVNLVALALLFVPGLNLVAFFGANAFLLGRGFFELAALRYCSDRETRELMQRHSLRILLAGALCAALAAVPIANLLTPLFATALMVRVAQPLLRNRPPQRAVYEAY